MGPVRFGSVALSTKPAIGSRAVRSAREAAHIVLLDDDFGTIVRAIAEGRALAANLRRSFRYLVAVHVPLVVSAAVGERMWNYHKPSERMDPAVVIDAVRSLGVDVAAWAEKISFSLTNSSAGT